MSAPGPRTLADNGSLLDLHSRRVIGRAASNRMKREQGFQVLINGKGNCYDNAAVETFFKTIKAELVWCRP